MRTTLDIDDDVLEAAKELGRRQRKTMGQVLSALARRALTASSASSASDGEASFLASGPFRAGAWWCPTR